MKEEEALEEVEENAEALGREALEVVDEVDLVAEAEDSEAAREEEILEAEEALELEETDLADEALAIVEEGEDKDN